MAQAEARLGTLLSMGDEMAHLRQHLANRDRLLELQGQGQGQQGQGQGQGRGRGRGPASTPPLAPGPGLGPT